MAYESDTLTVVANLNYTYPTVEITWDWNGIPGRFKNTDNEAELSYSTGGAYTTLDTYNYPQVYKIAEITANVAWTWRVRCRTSDTGTWSGYTTADAITMYGATDNDTITLTAGGAAVASYIQTGGDTVYLSDTGKTVVTVPLEPDFHYYFGDYDGNLYLEATTYTSDDGTAINCYWLSKLGDLADQDPEALDKFKYIARVRLWFVDVYSNTSVTIGVSADGATWETTGGNLTGTASGRTKVKEFNFITTGHILQFYIQNNTTSDILQWSAMEVDYQLLGDYFEI